MADAAMKKRKREVSSKMKTTEEISHSTQMIKNVKQTLFLHMFEPKKILREGCLTSSFDFTHFIYIFPFSP